MSITTNHTSRFALRGPRLLGLVALMLLLPVSNMAQQVLDLCGCAGDPTLQPFNAANPATYPPGTTGCTTNCTGGTIIVTTPPDGVLKFSSFTADGAFHIGFTRNAANTPVTLLVAGNVVLRGSGCCYVMGLNGGPGSSGSTSGISGVGALGGNGGFRGGDGSALGINGAAIGGSGLGPGGGAGGSQATGAAGGTFFGVPELLPLLGGSGGGGGGGFGAAANCTGGGGGGGGGAIVIVANGTISMQNYDIQAEGGDGGGPGSSSCANGGSAGSGGAIRLVAARLLDNGTGRLYVRAGNGSTSSSPGTAGRIRLESLDASAQTQFQATPVALRVTGPSPVVNPLSPTVRITSINGQLPPAVPQGGYGAIDVVLPAPGVTGVDVATSGVPSGTTVLVTVKPRIGGAALSATVPLNACNTAGECTATTAFNLAAGAYFVEARATFQVQ
jgi:hypothetical protein